MVVLKLLQITERLTDGMGNFDPEALLKKLPEDLALPEKKVANQMRILAKDRRRTTLVQVPAAVTSLFCRSTISLTCAASDLLGS